MEVPKKVKPAAKSVPELGNLSYRQRAWHPQTYEHTTDSLTKASPQLLIFPVNSVGMILSNSLKLGGSIKLDK